MRLKLPPVSEVERDRVLNSLKIGDLYLEKA
jgi:hypothetical protein